MKKSVIISSLAMRFYEEDGWTESLLRKYLDGEIKTFDNKSRKYFVLNPGSRLDVDRLCEDGHVGELNGRHRWGELSGMSDIDVMKERNW